MAIQINTTYTGRVEDLIYYERLGHYLIRTVGRQTTATKRAAKDFGRASSLSKNLRRVLSPIIPDPRDRKMHNSLTVAMRHFLAQTKRHISVDLQNNPLAGFRFAADSSLNECLLLPLNITRPEEGKVSIGIPAINPVEAIAAPVSTSKAEIMFMVATVHLHDDLNFASGPVSVSIPLSDGLIASQVVELEAGSEPGSMLIVAAAVRYWKGSKEIKAEGLRPVEIVAAGTAKN